MSNSAKCSALRVCCAMRLRIQKLTAPKRGPNPHTWLQDRNPALLNHLALGTWFSCGKLPYKIQAHMISHLMLIWYGMIGIYIWWGVFWLNDSDHDQGCMRISWRQKRNQAICTSRTITDPGMPWWSDDGRERMLLDCKGDRQWVLNTLRGPGKWTDPGGWEWSHRRQGHTELGVYHELE